MPVKYKPNPTEFTKYSRSFANKGIPQLKRDIALVKKGYKKIKDMVNVEYKEHSSFSTGSVINYSGIQFILNTIAQGSANGQRDGDSLKLQRLTLRGAVQLNAAGQETLVRMIIINDKNNIISSPSTLLTYNGSNLACFGNKQDENKYETKILYDRMIKVSNQSPITPFKINLPLNFHTNYTAGSSVINNGALKLIFLSNVNVSAPSTSFLYQLSYTDN